MAYEIIKILKEQQNLSLLKILSDAVSLREMKKGQLYKIFEESFDAKPIFSKKFLVQKINVYTSLSGKRRVEFSKRFY